MKIALILPGNIWFCPYVNIYTEILDREGISYEIISWNRDGQDAPIGYQYEYDGEVGSRLSKLKPYLGYVKFVKNVCNKYLFDKLIVFGPQLAIMLGEWLYKNYSGKYIFDYRDLSIEQNFIFKHRFSQILKESYCNVISSPGFKKCLPKGFSYLISHNFNASLVRETIDNKITFSDKGNPIEVLTIGGIRDYSSNIEIVKALQNNNDFNLKFVGKGIAARDIENFCIKNNISNVAFTGYYDKCKEREYIESCSVLNIYYPRIITHDTALSNRFYNSLIYKKPMIVTKNTIQGDYAEKYKIGLSIEDCQDLDKQLIDYINTLDSGYPERCNDLLKDFLKDQESFEDSLNSFINF